MKVSAIFLDLCGVLNNYHIAMTDRDHLLTNIGINEVDYVCTYKLELLKLIVSTAREQEIDLVIYGVSSWFSYKFEEMQSAWAEHGITIKDKLHTCGSPQRGISVLDKLVELKPDYFCILDDCQKYYPNVIDHPFYSGRPYYDIQQHVVAPHGRYGLTDHEFERALQLLGLTDSNYTGRYNPKLVAEKFSATYTKPFNVGTLKEIEGRYFNGMFDSTLILLNAGKLNEDE